MTGVRRCETLLLSLSILVCWSPAIKSAVDHGLVKKYFVDLYNEALVRAMQEQGQVEGTVRRSQGGSIPFIPYSQQADQNFSPQSSWKGEPKHKGSLHFDSAIEMIFLEMSYWWRFWIESKWIFHFSINTILTITSTGGSGYDVRIKAGQGLTAPWYDIYW